MPSAQFTGQWQGSASPCAQLACPLHLQPAPAGSGTLPSYPPATRGPAMDDVQLIPAASWLIIFLDVQHAAEYFVQSFLQQSFKAHHQAKVFPWSAAQYWHTCSEVAEPVLVVLARLTVPWTMLRKTPFLLPRMAALSSSVHQQFLECDATC